MFKNKPKQTTRKGSDDLEALLKPTTYLDHSDTHIVSLKRRAKLKQQEKHGRVRLMFLVGAVLSIIYLSFLSQTRPYQNLVVIVPTEPYNSIAPGNNHLIIKCCVALIIFV